MKYRRLGAAGVKVSEISLGGWLTFQSADARLRGQAVIDQAFDSGINFYDTANVYGGGICERNWGELLARYRRSSFVLATKVYFPMGDGPNDRGLSRKHIMEQCHASLDRLGTDYIDLYQCHRHDEDTPLEETVRAMDDLIRQGKVLYWGYSMWPAGLIEETFALCERRGYAAPVSSQPKYNLLIREIEAKVMPVSHAGGAGQVVFCPLEQGLLTGKYGVDRPPPEGSRALDEESNMFMKDLLGSRAVLEAIDGLRPLAEAAGCSLAQLALAWILRRPEISSCITGATRPEQVVENAAASGIGLDDGLVARVEALMAPVGYTGI